MTTARQLGQYRIDGKLGSGGMATVFSATHTPSGEAIALKVLRPELVGHPEARQRFLREARATQQVQYPNIVRVHDVGVVGDTPFIAMERLHGESLQDILTVRRRIPAEETLEHLTPIMEALALLHARGLVHRDVKASNIFLAQLPNGRLIPKLLDFGVAKLIGDGSALNTAHPLGTPHYMPPEQIQNAASVGPTADVWSMGVLLYRCLSGELPYVAENTTALLTLMMEHPPTSLRYMDTGAPTALIRAVERAMSVQAEKRYADMGAFLRELFEEGLVAPSAFESRHLNTYSTSHGTTLPLPPRQLAWLAAIGLGVMASALTALMVRMVFHAPMRLEAIPIQVENKPEKAQTPPSAPSPRPASKEQLASLGPLQSGDGLSGYPMTPTPPPVKAAPVVSPSRPKRSSTPRFKLPPSDPSNKPTAMRTREPIHPVSRASSPRRNAAPSPRHEIRETPPPSSPDVVAPPDVTAPPSQLNPRREARRAFRLAKKALAAGQPDEARNAYDEALRLVPNFVAALAGRAELKRTHEDLEGSLNDLELALEAEPQRPELLNARGRTYLDLKRFDAAVTDFSTAQKLAPQKDIFRKNLVSALFLRARNRQSAGDTFGAKSDLDTLLRLDPNHAPALKRRGVLRIEEGDNPGGQTDLRHYLELKPDAHDRSQIQQLLR